jgi:hypothetical protein
MDDMKTLRTSAYAQFGIFRASFGLKELGVTLPSEQLAAVAAFLRHGLGEQEDPRPFQGPADDVNRFMGALLRTTVERHRDLFPRYLRPLPALAEELASRVSWDPMEDFSELLSYICADVYALVAKRLAEQFSVHVLDIEPLASQFVLSSLPRSLRAFDLARGRGVEHAWLETTYARYARKTLAADARHRRQLQALHEAWLPARRGEDDEPEWERLRASLLASIERLPKEERRALELYYGLAEGGRERTVAEVAAALGCSLYLARAAVLHAVMQLAAQLGVRNGLPDQDYEFLQLYFREGRDLVVACRALDISQIKGRALLRRMQQTFVRALRRRTGRSVLSPACPAPAHPTFKEKTMPGIDKSKHSTTTPPPLVRPKDTNHRGPELKIDEKGHWLVYLDEMWQRIADVRDRLTKDHAFLEVLEQREIPLDWLAIPDLDLPRDKEKRKEAEQLEAALAELEGRAYDVASDLASTLLRRSTTQEGLDLPVSDPEQLAEHVLRALGGVVLVIEAGLPEVAWESDRALFRIQQEETGTRGSWEGGSGQPFDMERIIVKQAVSLGDFSWATGTELARLILHELIDGTSVLPGLPVEELSGNAVALIWRRPSLFAK